VDSWTVKTVRTFQPWSCRRQSISLISSTSPWPFTCGTSSTKKSAALTPSDLRKIIDAWNFVAASSTGSQPFATISLMSLLTASTWCSQSCFYWYHLVFKGSCRRTLFHVLRLKKCSKYIIACGLASLVDGTWQFSFSAGAASREFSWDPWFCNQIPEFNPIRQEAKSCQEITPMEKHPFFQSQSFRLALVQTSPASAETFTAKVVSVPDGDVSTSCRRRW